MSDIGLFWNDVADGADFALKQNDLESDDGLDTAVIISLFTDRRLDDGDVLPDAEKDRRGWWGDAIPVVQGDKIGSRLWLLARAKQLPDTLRRAEEYAKESLQWLIDDRVALSIDVTAIIVRNGVQGLTVIINRPNKDPKTYRFNDVWAAQEAKVF